MTVEELRNYGMEPMDDAGIRSFLSGRRMGVLGLPGESPDEAPYLLPMSFGFDGESRLYFTYVVGRESRKRESSDRATEARFLVFQVDTMFNWESVLMTGTVDEVPESELDEAGDAMPVGWRPDLFERAGAVEDAHVYRFDVEDWTGVKHTGLPPKFDPVGDDR